MTLSTSHPLAIFQNMNVECSAPASSPSALIVNAHVHLPPNFSAFSSVGQAVELAAEQGLNMLGVSNYYDYTVYREFTQLALQKGIFPIYGIETIGLIEQFVNSGVRLNDPGNPGKTYLCSKGAILLDPLLPAAQAIVDQIKQRDTERMNAMAKVMQRIFTEAGVDNQLDGETIRRSVATRSHVEMETVTLQERHLAQAFQEALFLATNVGERMNVLATLFGTPATGNCNDAAAVQNEIRSRLMKAGKRAFVPDTFIDFAEAYALTLAVGGIPAYPILADGASPICEYEQDIDALAEDLIRRSIYAVELIPIRNTPEVLARYVHKLRAKGLIVTAGTEHNTLDLLPIQPTCVNNIAIPSELQAVFTEGALVAAAHQYLVANYKEGYVSADGQLTGSFRTLDERITHFATLGIDVLKAFQKAAPLS